MNQHMMSRHTIKNTHALLISMVKKLYIYQVEYYKHDTAEWKSNAGSKAKVLPV